MQEISYILTGSRVFGGATDKSDIDVVMSQDKANALEDWCINNKIDRSYEHLSGPGFFITLCDLKLNIIVPRSEEAFTAWQNATEHMKSLPTVFDKEQRVRAFRKLVTEEYNKLPKNKESFL